MTPTPFTGWHTQGVGHRVPDETSCGTYSPISRNWGTPILFLWSPQDMGRGSQVGQEEGLQRRAAPTCDVHEEWVGQEGLATPGGLTLQVQGVAQQWCGHPHTPAVVPHHLLPIRPQC